MRILAIGGTGFIGARVVRRLARDGHEVAVLHRGRTQAALPEAVRHLSGDRDALTEALPEIDRFAPEVALDVVAYTERQARAFVDAFRGRVRRTVVLGSADVYRNYDGLRGRFSAPPDPAPLAEDAPLREEFYPYRGAELPPAWADDYEKILVERIVLGAADLPGTVLRLPAVYGPGDRQRRLRPYRRRMDDGRPAVLLSEAQAGWRWTHGYVENVAAAIALAVADDRAAGRIYNVGEARTPTLEAWVTHIGAAAGWTGRIVRLPETQLPAHLRRPLNFRYDLALDTGRIRRELGYAEPVDRAEALRRTMAWERAQFDDGDAPDLAAEYAAEDAVLTSIDAGRRR